MRMRAREEALRILEEHQPVPLANGIAARLDEIVQEAQARFVSH